MAALLRRWRRRGWLERAGASRRPVPRRRREAVVPQREQSSRDRRPAEGAARQRSYALLDTRFQVNFPSPVDEALAHPPLAHLETGLAASAEIRLDVERDGAGRVLRENGERVDGCASLEGLAPMVKAALWRIAVNRQRYFMEIHAGAVYDGHSCIVLPGAPGSGKSTLTAALTASGFGYLSDEAVLLEGEGLCARPVPLPLTVKCGSLGLLEERHPGLRDLPAHRRQDGRVVRYLPPPPQALLPDAALPVGALVFPSVAGETVLRPLGRIEALKRLLRECLVLPERLDEHKTRHLVRWMRRLSCYEMSLASLPEAIALLQGVSALRPGRRASRPRQIGNAA